MHSEPTEKLHDMRRSYEHSSLNEEDVASSPFMQFAQWFNDAQEAELLEPNAMVLATVDEKGMPNTRTVLLKSYDDSGLVFFTNYGSQKSKELQANSNVSLQFLWLGLERQVKIRGVAEKISLMESMKYFYSRPKGSQIGAWVSHQSEVVSGKSVLLNSFAKLKEQYKDGKVEFPKFWGGFRVKPVYFEFWQGGKDRLHDRVVYEKNSSNQNQSQLNGRQVDNWLIYRLAP